MVKPLRDIQAGIFNLDTTSYPEDNHIHGIDPELFAQRATHTSARKEASTNSGYQTRQCWSNPAKDNQSSILYPEPATNPENGPTFGVDPAPLTERATHPSTNVGRTKTKTPVHVGQITKDSNCKMPSPIQGHQKQHPHALIRNIFSTNLQEDRVPGYKQDTLHPTQGHHPDVRTSTWNITIHGEGKNYAWKRPTPHTTGSAFPRRTRTSP